MPSQNRRKPHQEGLLKNKVEEQKEENKEVSALIHLLDDHDVEVYGHVVSKLMACGPGIIPQLESAWSDSFDPELHERIEDLIHRIQFESLFDAFKKYVDENEFDLFTGACLIARFAYPEFKGELLTKDIANLRKDIWLELNYSLTPLEQVNIFNQVFFGNLGFKIDHVQHLVESDFYINKLIESRKGHPILLGLLYIILSRKLDFPLYGLNLPNHFALVFCREEIDFTEDPDDLRNEVIFYINPQNQGSIFTKNQIHEYLTKMDVVPAAKHYAPCSDKKIIQLLLTQLMNYFISKNDDTRTKELNRLIALIDGK